MERKEMMGDRVGDNPLCCLGVQKFNIATHSRHNLGAKGDLR